MKFLEGLSYVPLRSESDLPRGAYFYHHTELDRLEYIKKEGLLPRSQHGKGRVDQSPFFNEREDMLYFYTKERACLNAVLDYNEIRENSQPARIALRIERSVLKNSILFRTPGHPYNYIDGVFSFSVNCSIPPEEIQICVLISRNPKWLPIRAFS